MNNLSENGEVVLELSGRISGSEAELLKKLSRSGVTTRALGTDYSVNVNSEGLIFIRPFCDEEVGVTVFFALGEDGEVYMEEGPKGDKGTFDDLRRFIDSVNKPVAIDNYKSPLRYGVNNIL